MQSPLNFLFSTRGFYPCESDNIARTSLSAKFDSTASSREVLPSLFTARGSAPLPIKKLKLYRLFLGPYMDLNVNSKTGERNGKKYLVFGGPNHLVRSNFANMALPLRIQRWRGVRPLESVAFIFAPYCNRSSNMPISAESQARWRRVQPSRSSMVWPSLVPAKFREPEEDLSDEFPVKLLELRSRLVCSFSSIALARVKEEIHETCSYTALTSTSKLTMWRYTAFLSLVRTPSQIWCATEWRYWLSFGLRTKSFSAYCNQKKTKELK